MKTHTLLATTATTLALVATCTLLPSPTASAAGAKGDRRAALLQRFDANADGQLDDAERATARQAFSARIDAFLEAHPKLKARVLAKHDTDKDGTLSPAEKQAAREAAPHKGRRLLRLAAAGKLRHKLLEKFDADHNGQLDDAERAAARAAAKARRAGGQ